MRKALNENPLVQVAMIGVLALVVGFLLITRMGSGGGSSDSTAETSSSAAVTPATSVEPLPTAGSPVAETAPASAPSGGFEAGPGLPAKVVDAHEGGETVVLLIVHRKGIDDRELTKEIGSAASAGETALFVAEADDIADYSRIAEGVDVDRVPALVVIEPKSRADGALPTASVSYGYRGPESIAQAVRDARYDGREDLPYHPE